MAGYSTWKIFHKGVALGKVEYLQNKRVMGLKLKVFNGEWRRKSLLNIGGEENKVCQSPGLVAWTSSIWY